MTIPPNVDEHNATLGSGGWTRWNKAGCIGVCPGFFCPWTSFLVMVVCFRSRTIISCYKNEFISFKNIFRPLACAHSVSNGARPDPGAYPFGGAEQYRLGNGKVNLPKPCVAVDEKRAGQKCQCFFS
jgi:hypothetical protein